MNLHFFVVISELMIQVPQIKIQHRTPLWRIYFPHYQARKLNRKDKVKKLFLTCCQTNPIYFHCLIYRTTAAGKGLLSYFGRAHSWKGTESEVAPGTQPSQHWGGAKAATVTPPGNPSLSSCQVLYYKCTSQHLCTKLNYRGMQTCWEIGKTPHESSEKPLRYLTSL